MATIITTIITMMATKALLNIILPTLANRPPVVTRASVVAMEDKAVIKVSAAVTRVLAAVTKVLEETKEGDLINSARPRALPIQDLMVDMDTTDSMATTMEPTAMADPPARVRVRASEMVLRAVALKVSEMGPRVHSHKDSRPRTSRSVRGPLNPPETLAALALVAAWASTESISVMLSRRCPHHPRRLFSISKSRPSLLDRIPPS